MSYTPAPTHRLLHVSFTFLSGPTKTKELEPVFNQATDWFRYAPNCWLVWTTGTTDTWYPPLRQQISDKDYLFVVEITGQNYNAWLPQGARDWLIKYGLGFYPPSRDA